MVAELDALAAKWTRLGAVFGIEAASETPDIERLLLDTARHAHLRCRLFIVAATWLSKYADYVDASRLSRLIQSDLEREHRPTLGLMLDWAQSNGGGVRLDAAIEACGTAIDARPLSDVFRGSAEVVRVAAMEATPLSNKWGRWIPEIRLRTSALRARDWVSRNNPTLAEAARISAE